MAKVMAIKIKRIYIEITNICNLSCSFCSKHHRKNKMLSLDEFQSIIQEVKQYIPYYAYLSQDLIYIYLN